jgi:two-component system LytT family response regulator
MIRAIAIDDEPVALDIITAHARKVPFVQLEASFISATSALNYIKENPIDLIFLDISMPDVSGLEFAVMVPHKVQIIFTTAYPEHALKGFELAATDYLLKPVNFTRFLKACQLAEARDTSNTKDEAEKTIFVKDGHNWVQIKLSEILYIQAQDNYVSICENNKSTLTRMTLNEVEQKLPEKDFVKVHKSYIIAVARIEKIVKDQIIVNGLKIPISKSYKNILLEACTK